METNGKPVADETQVKGSHGVPLRDAFWVWLKIAALSFGGPAGQIALMHRVVVEEKRWISDQRFLHALNFCMLLPGPEAQQLATYIGWLMHRTAGGLIAGGLFILPGAVAILGLSYVYAAHGDVGIVAALFFGLKAAVLAIVLDALIKLSKRALKNSVLRAAAVSAFVAIFFVHVPFPVIVFIAGLVGWLGARSQHPAFSTAAGVSADSQPFNEIDNSLLGDRVPDHARPSVLKVVLTAIVWAGLWLVPVIALLAILGGDNVFSQIAIFFSKMAMVTFGGAYAVLAYVAQEAVERLGWLKPGEMLDGLGMAETTPGPLIMVLQFVGYLAAHRDGGALSPWAAGALGAALTTWVTFMPCFLWIFIGAPFIERLRGNTAIAGALTTLTAAVVGIILNLAVWFAVHTLFDDTVTLSGFGMSFDAPVLTSANPWAIGLAIIAALGLWVLRLGVVPVLAICSIAGIALNAGGFI